MEVEIAKEKIDTSEVTKNLLNIGKEEINLIWNSLHVIPDERSSELVELVADFCNKCGVLLPFIKSVIKLEVDNTKEITTLFREDSFAMRVVNRVLFNDHGLQFLTFLHPVLKKLNKYNEFEISNPKSKNFDKSLKSAIKILEEFVKQFNENYQSFPLVFREMLALIQETIDNKFGKSDEHKIVLDFVFFRFICLAVIDPIRYGLVEEEQLTKPAMKNLVVVSKLLNHLARNAVDRYEEKQFQKLVAFFQENSQPLLNKIYSLMDRQQTKGLSATNIAYSDIEQSIAKEKLIQFLEEVVNGRSSPRTSIIANSTHSVDPLSIMTKKYLEYLSIVNDAQWKKVNTSTKLADVWTWKDPETNIVRIKSRVHIDVPFKAFFEHVTAAPENVRILWSDVCQDIECIYDVPHYKEYQTLFSMPFPFSNRRTGWGQWEYLVDDKTAVIINDGLSIDRKKLLPKHPGYVLGTGYISGTLLQADPSSPATRCILTTVGHGNPGGSIPLWLVNSYWKRAESMVVQLKVKVEIMFNVKDHMSPKYPRKTRSEGNLSL